MACGCGWNGHSDWMHSRTIFRRVWDFLFFSVLGLFDMCLENEIYCTPPWGILGISGAANS